MAQTTDLGTRASDVAAIAARGLLGAMPCFGALLAEVVSNLIPNQRLDRIERFAMVLHQTLERLGHKAEELNDRLTSPEFVDVLEDGMWQASRALSHERLRYIASVLAHGLSEPQLNHARTKKLLQLLDSLTDLDIVWLKYQSLAEDPKKPEEFSPEVAEFWQRHRGVLEGLERPKGEEERDAHALRGAAKQTLHQFGLVESRATVGQARPWRGHGRPTEMGRWFLKYIGAEPDSLPRKDRR